MSEMSQPHAESSANDRVALMQVQFDGDISQLRSSSAKKSVFLSDGDYCKLVLDMHAAKKKERKDPRDYWLLNRYDVMLVENESKLIHPLKQGDSAIQFYVSV